MFQRTRSRIVLAAVLAGTLPIGAVQAVPAFARAGRAAAGPISAAPVQRTGSAAGLAHLLGQNGNQVVPASLRSRYPVSVPAPAAPVPQPVRLLPATAASPAGFRPGVSIEQVARRSRFSRTYANPDGTATTVVSADPVNYQAADGRWQPIQPRLVRTGGGELAAAGGAEQLRLADRLGTGPVAELTLDAGHRIGWTALAARPVPVAVAGPTAVYRSFEPGADLELTSLAGGVKETIVLRSPSAPASYGFRLALTGLTARLAGAQLNLLDSAGTVRAVVPAGSMTDAAGARSTAVRYLLAGNVLRIVPDPSWLHDPRRMFPVRLDPSVLGSTAASALTVQDGAAYTGGQDFQVGVRSGVRSAAYLAFPGVSGQLANETVYSAKLSVVDYDAATCTPHAVGVYPVTGAWSASDTSLRYPGPSVGAALASRSYGYGYVGLGQQNTSCPVAETLYDLGAAGRDLVQGWVTGKPNYGLSLRASGTDPAAWKRFTGTATANPPKLYITHSPYNARYSIPKPVLNPPVLQNQDGQITVLVTNLGAETWTPSTYYLAYRISDKTGRVVAQQKAAGLAGNVARNARVSLAATVQAMPVGTYTLDFTMVHVGGPVFTDDWVPPARLLLQVFNVPPVPQAVYPRTATRRRP